MFNYSIVKLLLIFYCFCYYLYNMFITVCHASVFHEVPRPVVFSCILHGLQLFVPDAHIHETLMPCHVCHVYCKCILFWCMFAFSSLLSHCSKVCYLMLTGLCS